jgi:hypothetical protein
LPVSELTDANDGPMWVVLRDKHTALISLLKTHKICLVKWEFGSDILYPQHDDLRGYTFSAASITHFMPIQKPELPK